MQEAACLISAATAGTNEKLIQRDSHLLFVLFPWEYRGLGMYASVLVAIQDRVYDRRGYSIEY